MIKNKKKIKFISILCILLTVILLMVIICKYHHNAQNKNQIIVTTLVSSQMNSLNNDFIPMFKKKYPNIKIKLNYILKDNQIDSNWNNLDKIINQYINKNKIDILYGFPLEDLSSIIKSGNLKNLDEYLKKYNFPIKNIAPGSIYPIKCASKQVNKKGLFALSPSFNNSVLLYNKTLFDKIYMTYPSNSMTWNELFNLCNKVKSKCDNNVSVLQFGPIGIQGFYGDFKNIITPYKFNYIENNKLITDSDKFVQLWGEFSNAYRKYSMNIYDGNDFIKGYAFMRLIYPPELKQLKKIVKSENIITKDKYGLVSLPKFSEFKNIGLARPTDIMSIVSKSPNKDLSWKLIEFANGKEYAEHYASSNTYSFTGGLPSYFDQDIKKIYLNKTTFDFTPFYLDSGVLQNKSKLDGNLISKLDFIASQYMYKSLREKKSYKILLKEFKLQVNNEILKNKIYK